MYADEHLAREERDVRWLALSVLLHAAILAMFSAWRTDKVAERPSADELILPVTLSPLPAPEQARFPEASPAKGSTAHLDVSKATPERTTTVATAPVRRELSLVPELVNSIAEADAAVSGNSSGEGVGRGGADAGVGAGSARAVAMASEEHVGPDWIRHPTPGQMVSALSIVTFNGRISGGATLSCLITPANRVRDCRILSETQGSHAFGVPYGFGQSALRLSREFRIRPPIKNGVRRFDVRVRIPIYWEAQ